MSNVIKRHWAMGIEAGDLVYIQGQADRMAWVIEFIPELANEFYAGQVPILYLHDPKKDGIVWVPADDLIRFKVAPKK